MRLHRTIQLVLFAANFLRTDKYRRGTTAQSRQRCRRSTLFKVSSSRLSLCSNTAIYASISLNCALCLLTCGATALVDEDAEPVALVNDDNGDERSKGSSVTSVTRALPNAGNVGGLSAETPRWRRAAGGGDTGDAGAADSSLGGGAGIRKGGTRSDATRSSHSDISFRAAICRAHWWAPVVARQM